jgi:hypothetical protein
MLQLIWKHLNVMILTKTLTTNIYNLLKKKLATSISLVQQGAEFLLKARIAEISPFLLISGDPSEWPHKCDKDDTSFADFKTIDAQELIRVYNTIHSQKLSDDFIAQYDKLRRLRNTIMHTVSQIQITFVDVLTTTLEVNHVLGKPGKWIATRHTYIGHEPYPLLDPDNTIVILCEEITKAIDILNPSKTMQYFGFNKRQRRYICENCLGESDYFENRYPRLAHLKPNNPDSTNLYCILCEQDRTVIRKDCINENCKGNVIDAETRECLTCNFEQDDII